MSTSRHNDLSIWLAGTLANHRRGRVLKTTVNAQPRTEPEQGGICLLFGSDFQEGSEQFQQDWSHWSQKPGRTLLLIPPFKSAACLVPLQWQAVRRVHAAASRSNPFLQSLAAEVHYELQGKFQIATHLGGTWDDQSICTAYYCRHPHSGIFAVTCLPLWSLVVLDRASALQSWLGELHALAGTVMEKTIEAPTFKPQSEHFTVLLHLLGGSFLDETAALDALQSSAIFRISLLQAQRCLQDLQTHELVEGVKLTAAGRELIQQSPYATYANELEALSP